MEELIVLSGCGVFVGLSIYASNQSFESSSRHGHGISSYTAVTNAVSVSAGRISFAYGLKGPAMCLDTACSSALVASSVAFQTDIQTSYVSCIALLLTPTASDAFHASGMLASDGRCKTMDARANGYVRSEGCYSLLLDVNHDNRVRMLCCVINQDGRSSSLTAPNGNSQSSLLRDALVLSASDSLISNFELHGTGTALGDPIEMGAIQSSVAHCQIGSFGAAKSRQGHAEACAGMRGLLNSVACSSRSICAPFTHLVTLNQYVRESLGSDALALSRMQYATLSSRVNVSSFGFSGPMPMPCWTCVAKDAIYLKMLRFIIFWSNLSSASTTWATACVRTFPFQTSTSMVESASNPGHLRRCSWHCVSLLKRPCIPSIAAVRQATPRRCCSTGACSLTILLVAAG